MQFLSKYRKVIPQFQYEAFEQYFKSRVDSGELKSTVEFSQDLEEAVKQIDPTNAPLFIPVYFPVFSRTRSKVYNEMMDYIKMDLLTLFKESNLSFHVLGVQENLSKDFNDNVNDAIIHLQGELDAQRIKFGNAYGQKYATFESFTDMTGRTFQNARIRHGDLTLDTYSTEIHIYTVEDVEIYRYPGSGVELIAPKITDVEFNPRVLQPGLHIGYWAEMILSDEVPQLRFQDHDIIPKNKIFDGVLVVLRLTFATPISMNGLDVDPFTVFDLRVPWVRYRRDDSLEWVYLTSDGTRISSQGREIITFKNIDRVNHVKRIEIPFWQVNSVTDRYTIPRMTKSNMDFLEDLFIDKYDNMQNIQTNDVYLPSEETNYDMASNILMQGGVNEVFNKLASILGLEFIKFKRIGSRFVTEKQEKSELFLEQTEKHEYVYGAYSILPMDLKYKPQGLFQSLPIDLVSQSINSFSIFTSDNQPDITSANYFIEIDSGQKYPLAPMGVQRIKEHLPIVNDSTIIPRAYMTSEYSANEYIIQTECDPKTVNKFIPTFYIDETRPYAVYKNGIEVSGIIVDPKEKYFYEDVSGEYNELVSTDIIVADYYIDDLYQPPGRVIFPAAFEPDASGETSGVFAISLEGMYPLDITKDYDLYFGFPDTQWFLIGSPFYSVEQEAIFISGSAIYDAIALCDNITSLNGIKLMFEYYSTVDEFNGNFGRRDFTGSPYIVDLTQFHLGRLTTDFGAVPESTAFKLFSLQRYSAKFKLTNYVLELPSIPIIDYRLYNYDGTWKNDPNTGDPYVPIEVKFGDVVAKDMTNYLSEKQNLHLYEDIGEYEYYLKKNYIYFNVKEVVADVSVSYNYITENARLRIELNANVPTVASYTPVVYDYTLSFGVIDW